LEKLGLAVDFGRSLKAGNYTFIQHS